MSYYLVTIKINEPDMCVVVDLSVKAAKEEDLQQNTRAKLDQLGFYDGFEIVKHMRYMEIEAKERFDKVRVALA